MGMDLLVSPALSYQNREILFVMVTQKMFLLSSTNTWFQEPVSEGADLKMYLVINAALLQLTDRCLLCGPPSGDVQLGVVRI